MEQTMNESYTDATNNELASYIGVLQNEIGAEKNPKKLAMLKQDLEDVKSELEKRKSMNESQEDEYFVHQMKFRAGIIK
jgi:protein required for attachment to host cells